MCWVIEQNGFQKDKIELNGNKFLLGNGYMGYRGTMEEYSKEQLVSCILSGVYDKVGDAWREPVNAPNGLITRLYCNGELLSLLNLEPEEHVQSLDIKSAVHKRKTLFRTSSGVSVMIKSERFLSLENLHLICMRYSFKVSKECRIIVETGIDGDVWDINGPHLKDLRPKEKGDLILLDARTNELGLLVRVVEGVEMPFGVQRIRIEEKAVFREIAVDAKPDTEYCFYKYVSVFTGNDGVDDVEDAALKSCAEALDRGYDETFSGHARLWDDRWKLSDVKVEGDDEAQTALRYSIYHLLSIAPVHSHKVSIPARGLSGQVYKGAVFWDTEIFMLPFFLYTNPAIARNLIMYRIHTLDGARRKAAEYGFKGAFYAWESQDTGDDACTHFNITDVFTGRPMRTYFRDKQVHISADVVYAIWQYYLLTRDESILLDGGAEVILECARFFYSYSYYKKEKNRYEILDVTGPDEYHERVNNNAYTNMMAKYTLEVAVEMLKLLEGRYPDFYGGLISKLGYEEDIKNIIEMDELLYLPEPDPKSLVIEQFDGYCRLEDISLDELKKRILKPNEYLGGGNGLAANTKIIKQADIVLMLYLFKDRYSQEVKEANWRYYEPRTEHGSSLSSCIYALLACDIGNAEWSYKYFMKTATIDLTGESKQYVGTLYIGGTHPAANGGAWMSAVLGFGGVSFKNGIVHIAPKLPGKWKSLLFSLTIRGVRFIVTISDTKVRIKHEEGSLNGHVFSVYGQVKKFKKNEEEIVWVREKDSQF